VFYPDDPFSCQCCRRQGAPVRAGTEAVTLQVRLFQGLVLRPASRYPALWRGGGELPTEGVESPSLEIFKTHLDAFLVLKGPCLSGALD